MEIVLFSLKNTFLGQMFFIFGNYANLLILVDFQNLSSQKKGQPTSKFKVLQYMFIALLVTEISWPETCKRNSEDKLLLLQMFYKSCFQPHLKQSLFSLNVPYICDTVHCHQVYFTVGQFTTIDFFYFGRKGP